MMMISKEIWKKIFAAVCIFAYSLAAVGGIAYLFSDHHGVFAIAAIATTAMATPYLIERIKEIL